jgi:hypothetical protein
LNDRSILHPVEIIVSQQEATMLHDVPIAQAEPVAGATDDQVVYLLADQR